MTEHKWVLIEKLSTQLHKETKKHMHDTKVRVGDIEKMLESRITVETTAKMISDAKFFRNFDVEVIKRRI